MTTTKAPLLGANGRPLPGPVVYLDHSTLVDAFDGTRGEGPDAAINAELAAVVEDVARRGTLCLSFVHLVELANRRFDEAFAMARWLDGLNPMWFQVQGAAEDELAYEVGRRLGLDGLDKVDRRLPIHRAMTAALRENLDSISVAGTVDLLRCTTIAATIREAHGKLDREVYARQSLDIFEKLHVDRSTLPPGTTREEVAAKARLQLGWHLQYEARAPIHARLIIIDEKRPTDLDITAAVLALLDEKGALSLNKVASHVLHNVGDRIADQKLRSGNFEERYASFAMDMRHALAAAVVDVFTCDSYVDSVMTDFRTSRGMSTQLSLHGRDRAALVAELRRQCA